MAQFSNFLSGLMSQKTINLFLTQKQYEELIPFLESLYKILKTTINAQSEKSDPIILQKLLQNKQYNFIVTLKLFTLSNLSSKFLKAQSLGKINEQMSQIVYNVSELIFRLALLEITFKDKEKIKGKVIDQTILIRNIQKILQKLRFEIQIDNMNKMGEQNFLIFDDFLEKIFEIIFRQRSQESQKVCMLFYEAMKQETSNVSDHLIEKLKIMIQQNTLQDKQKDKSNQYKRSGFDFLMHQKRSIEQKEALQKRQQQTKNQIKPYISTFKKQKPIQKTRTIYHSRKNIYMPKKKNQNFIEKSQNFDHATQWSSTFSKVKRSNTDINQDFQQDVLVQKTPKANKFYFSSFLNQKPIQLRLDFLD